MARIRRSHLGTPSGRVGNEVYRNRNKKTIAYAYTEKIKKSDSDAVQKNEALFARVTKISNFINQPVIVKNVWKYSKLPGAYSNLKLFKYNYKTIRSWDISSDLRILPPNRIYENHGIIFGKDILTLNFKVSAALHSYSNQTQDFNPPYHLIAFIYAKDPVDPSSEHEKVKLLLVEKHDDIIITPFQEFSFSFKSAKDKFSFIDEYNTLLVFPAVVSEDESTLIYSWAEMQGFYVKGYKPTEKLYKPVPPSPVINNQSFIEYD